MSDKRLVCDRVCDKKDILIINDTANNLQVLSSNKSAYWGINYADLLIPFLYKDATNLPHSLRHLPELAGRLGGVRIGIKRDDSYCTSMGMSAIA